MAGPAARHRNHSKGSRDSSFANLAKALLSLQFKATALVVILTLTVTGVVAFYLIRSSGHLARQQYGEQMLASATLLAKAAAPLISVDPAALERLAKEYATGQPLMHVTFTDTQGAALAESGNRPGGLQRQHYPAVIDRSATPGLPMVRSEKTDGPMLMDLTYPITGRPVQAPSGTP